jgi:hypothetical protein
MGLTISEIARLENEADDAIRLRKGSAFTRAELRIQRIETHLLDPSPRLQLAIRRSEIVMQLAKQPTIRLMKMKR